MKLVLSSILAVTIFWAASNSAHAQAPYLYGLGANRYLMKDGNLWGGALQHQTLVATFSNIDNTGWDGDFEVSGRFLYLMKNGLLYIQEIDGITRLGSGLQQMSGLGWNGDLEVEDGFLYLMRNGNLYGAALAGAEVSALQVISSGGWEGDVEINDGFVYLARNGDLYGAAISGLSLTSGLVTVNTGGWTGDVELQGHDVYIMKNSILYGATISGLNLTSAFVTMNAGGWYGDLEFNDTKLPIWQSDMSFASASPVITGTSLFEGSTYDLVADPYILEIDGRLYCFFEAQQPGHNGEIWMASTTDASLRNWAGFRQIAASPTMHFSHPQAVRRGSELHIFYNYNGNASVFTRHIAVTGLSSPRWSAERLVFGCQWNHLVEFSIFQHASLWYFLGITAEAEGGGEDKQVRGLWSATFPGDWPTQPSCTDWGAPQYQPIAQDPLFTVPSWARGMVEITYVSVDNTALLLFGLDKADRTQEYQIGAFEVTSLSTSGLTGSWISAPYSQTLTSTTWAKRIHRAGLTRYQGQWAYVFDGDTQYADGRATYVAGADNPFASRWAIGFATIHP